MSSTQSPFSPPPRGFTFGVDWMLLLMVVAAAGTALVGYALFLPSVTTELNAWLGRTVAPGDEDQNRFRQIVFLILCYSMPMILAAAARAVQLAGRKLASWLPREDQEDDRFRME
ncbi:MAG: hypothetical protein ACTHK7_24040 [Aureliella sp.]